MENQEIEVKFFVRDLEALRKRLEESGAQLILQRTLETNLRFDTPEGHLAQLFQVLRLRQNSQARLTYKGPAQAIEGVRIRQEIEFVVEDFDKARQLLEALGYAVSLIYEKYRTIYKMAQAYIYLDEMPYGDFLEIEGPDVQAIRQINEILKLSWDANIPFSYTVLFEQLKAAKGLSFRDLNFENFKGVKITAQDLGIQPAD